MQLKIRRIILYTFNLPKIIEFYREVFDLKVVYTENDAKWVELDGGSVSLSLHQNPKLKPAAKMKIAFYSKDVLRQHARLKKQKIKVGPLHSFGTIRFFNFKDPEGNSLQISNRP